ncbi:MAG TPA: PKD domain-containing protein [Solirubrobacteraceae bacterium]|jgi:hypothetical protein
MAGLCVALFACGAGAASPASGESPAASASALYNLKAYPLASFVWLPSSPHPGQVISLVSTSSDHTSPIIEYAWDLADNGPFGPFAAGGAATSTTFPTPAEHQVRLRVTAADHLSSTAVETIRMSTPAPGVLLPFPVVRILGRVYGTGVRLRELGVKAPAGARITLSCQGAGCPARSAARLAAGGAGRLRLVRFRQFERYLPARAVVQIRVSKGSTIGAYTRFTVRRRKLPLRVDSCLAPTGVKPIACPP